MERNPGDQTIKPERKKQIPLSWFIGIGRKDHGILTIAFSVEFQKMGDRKIQDYINKYGHHSQFEGDREIVEEAARKIKEITGFTMEELHKKSDELLKLYKGKKEAPFEFRLF